MYRVDTVELALESGWDVDSTDHTDEFARDGITITVKYTPQR